MITALLTILALFLVGMLIPHLMTRSFLGPIFRIFVIPGVILHELAHAGACLLTGAEIQRIRFFKRDGGDLAHTEAKIPILGPLIITMAPLIIGFLAIILLGHKLVPAFNQIPNSVNLHDFPSFALFLMKSVHWRVSGTWVLLYLILSVGATLTPSLQDLKNSWIPLVIVMAVMAFVFHDVGLHSAADHYAVVIIPALTIALFIMLVIALMAFILYLLSSIFGINR